MPPHEKQCKSCGVTFTGFTPVCKECNAKKGEENAIAKAEKVVVATEATRTQPPGQNVTNRTQQRPEAFDGDQQKSFFNNNKNYGSNNRRGGYQDGGQNHYSSDSAFGGGFRKKKEQGNNGGFEHQSNPTFSRMNRNNNRNQAGNYPNTIPNKNYDREDRSQYQDPPKAFDFRNNRPRNDTRQMHTPFQQNTQNQEAPPQERNPFTHLKKVCERFKEGKCNYGDRCRFSHTEPPSKAEKNKAKEVVSQDFSKDGFGQRL